MVTIGHTFTCRDLTIENLIKPHVRDEIVRRQEEIRERLEISTQAKRRLLWKTASECAKYGEVSRSVKIETMPDGTVVKTIHILSSVFDPKASIKAIVELNRMDGDYAGSGNGRFI